MKAIFLEGSAEEISEALKRMGVSSALGAVVTPQAAPAEPERGGTQDDAESGHVPLRVARKAITRRHMYPLQQKMLELIYNAGEGGILASDLQDELDYEPAQFRGLMGAFGRRVANTPGYADGDWFFDQEWQTGEQCYRYRLAGDPREAVRREIIEKK